MRLLLGIVWLPCLLGCGAQHVARPLAATAALEVYVVTTADAPGAQRFVDPTDHLPIYLAAAPILSAKDVASIQRSGSADQPSLSVNLTPAGATKLTAATAQPAGMQVGFVINGVLVSAPPLTVPLTSGFRITGGLISEQRDQIFSTLTDS